MTSLQFRRLEANSLDHSAHWYDLAAYWREQCEILTAEPMPLTPKQERALGIIKRYKEYTGLSPTLREFAFWLGETSVSNAHRYLVALEERGHIKRLPGRERAITVISKGE